jgi:hypothetical protein
MGRPHFFVLFRSQVRNKKETGRRRIKEREESESTERERKKGANDVIQLLTANYWLLRQQSNISVISAKVVFSNFGPTTNPLLLPFLVF